jgi:hypothetical protein
VLHHHLFICPLSINRKASLPAILEAWQSGQAQGIAIAETLFGLNNPAGRTAVSFPVSADALPVFYNYHPTASRGSYNNPPIISGGTCKSLY